MGPENVDDAIAGVVEATEKSPEQLLGIVAIVSGLVISEMSDLLQASGAEPTPKLAKLLEAYQKLSSEVARIYGDRTDEKSAKDSA